MEAISKEQVNLRTVLRHYMSAFSRKQKLLYCVSIFLQIIRTSSFVLSPFFYKRIFDFIGSHYQDRGPEVFKYILTILVVLVVIRVVAWVAARANALLVGSLLANTKYQLRSNAYDYLLKHSYTFFSNNFIGSLTHKLNKYGDSLWNINDKIINDFVVFFVKIIGILLVLFFVDKRIFFGMFLFICIFIFVSLKISKKRKPISIELSAKMTKLNGQLSDSAGNQNSVLLFSNHVFELLNFKKLGLELVKITKKRVFFDTSVAGIYSAFIICVEIGLISFAIYLWSINQATIGTIVLIQSYIVVLIDDIWGFSRVVQHVEEAYADAKEMVEILETPHEVQDKKDAGELVIHEGKINFENVTFAYNDKSEALSDLTLSIMPGEKIGLIGPSGAGKSTFVKLLLRFFDTTAGAVLIDGQNISDVTQDSLHNAIGYVPQDPALFHRSLMDNIRYGRRDATDEEVIEASRKAHAHEFISKLPEGYNTLVGERGIKLSGGERQRVAIARAILKNAPILVLDEATSALDSESERLIQDALNILMEGKTVLVIAHRLSTIQHMDRILVIDGGKITEDGTHAELLKAESSLYKKLWELQAGGFIN